MSATRQSAAVVLAPGSGLGHYRILEKVGAGGMGEVYRALDEHLDREVAIKMLSPELLGDADARSRLHDEALTLSRINHPNIAIVHDFDSQSGTDFLVTEYVSGKSLTDLFQQGPLPEKQVLELGIQLADGLCAAHAQGVVHRDLKPGNLRFTSSGQLKILDFGLAVRTALPTNTPTTDVAGGSTAGTLAYMAPEQMLGSPPDVRSDIYSAGVVLYEAASGRLPFKGDTAPAFIDAVLHGQPVPIRSCLPSISANLEQIISRCLARDPEHRYQSARDLLADIRRAIITGPDAQLSVAVMYFDNLSRRPEDEYFRDGITEDIATELTRIGGLHVFSRSAVLGFRDRPVTPSYVGSTIGATHVIEGSVQRGGDRLRITAKLVETKTGHAIWAEKYDRSIEDVFAIQDELAESIATVLRVVLTDREKHAIGKIPTADVRAYDSYLQGRQLFHQFRRKGYDLARQMFAHAIEIDPQYARAYAGIADCCSFIYMYWESSEENLAQAESASDKALQLDPELADAHASRGLTASLRKQYDLAQHEFESAMRLNPRLFEAYYFCARSLYAQGKLDEAIHWFEQASRVQPEDYQSPMLMASALHGLGRAESAHEAYRVGLAAAEKHLQFHPTDARALYFGANALSQLNERDRAIEWAERALSLEPDEHQVLYNVACVYALIGEHEKAMDCLEKSLTRGWVQKEWMRHDPDLAPLRSNPRFQQLVS